MIEQLKRSFKQGLIDERYLIILVQSRRITVEEKIKIMEQE